MYNHLSKYYNQLFPLDPELFAMLENYVKKDEKAIDLGCGTGRLTYLIDKYQMDVLGIDLDKEMIHYAKQSYPNILFSEQNMVDALTNHYHLITCFGNTLPHLNPENLLIFFKKIKQTLNMTGYAIFEMLNYDKILLEKPSHLKPIEIDGIRFSRLYTYDAHSIEFTTILENNHQVLSGTATIYPYKVNELEEVIKNTELNCNFYGSLDQKPHQDSDYRIYMVVTQK